MELEIQYDTDADLVFNFCIWLLPQILEVGTSRIDEREIEPYNDYLNKQNILKSKLNPNLIINCRDIIISCLDQLIIEKGLDNSYRICLNPKINYPNSYAKFIDIAKLINYGNLSLNGCRFFDKLFEYFAENLNNYYEIYLREYANEY